MPLPETEQVLVVPTQVFHDLGYFQGFCGDVDRYLDRLLSLEHTSYRPRGEMEKNPGFKQLIPYVVLRHIDPAGGVQLFCYTRGSGQGERRLHSKRSIGIGGHICSDDGHRAGAYQEGMRRELAEEVAVQTGYRERCVGLINDDQTEVGKVHLGVVHLWDLDSPQVEPQEEDLADAAFVPLGDLLNDLERFESWSQICLQALFTGGGSPEP